MDFFSSDGVPRLLLFLFGVFLLIFALVAWRQPRPQDAAAQYDEFVPGFKDGPDRFYALVYDRLQADLTESRLPFASLSFGPRPLFSRRHILSARCLYLEVRYQDVSYFVYAVPAPGGLYVSTWLFSKSLRMVEHPILKWLVWWRNSRMTLFQFDITRLFHLAVAGAVSTVLDELRREQGLRPLEEYERRPVLRGFYGAMRGVGQPGMGGGGVPASDAGLFPIAHRSVEHQPISHPPLTHQPVIKSVPAHPDFEGVGSASVSNL